MGISQELLRRGREAFLRGYKATSLVLTTTLVLFVLLNIACYVVLKVTRPDEDASGYRTVDPSLHPVMYPGLDEGQRARFFREMRGLKYVFEPFTHFKVADRRGEFVNVRDGIRHLEEGAWPPRKDETPVFVFGGSTTFGAGPDAHTIPSFLQEALRRTRRDARVYNFGRIYYYSTQERALFEQLLQAGHAPRVAVFIDGLNDFYHAGMEVPQLERFKQVFEGRPRWPAIPVVKAWRAISGAERARDAVVDPGPEGLRAVIDRYLANKRLIEAAGRAFGVAPVFVWQPVPTYGLDSPHYPFRDEDLGRHVFSRKGYPMMREVTERADMGDRFLWLADLHAGFQGPMYVDQVHYSADFAKAIAEAIAAFLRERGLLEPGGSK
jgi:hypothetical protein